MKKNLLILLPVIILVAVLILLFVPIKQSLVFYDENTSDIEAYLPLENQETFQIIFTHSIHLTDVVEKYIVLENQDIQQYEIIYEEFGIGMPSNAYGDEEFVHEDGKYHIRNMENIFPEIKLRNGKTVSEHRLVWGSDQEFMAEFNDYFEPGAWFTIKIDKLSLWQMIQGVRIHE
ncbi:DUF1850 domain-containing protein [Salinicoccus sp. Marseille-QA3877]